MKTPLVPISWGELIDKITILEIKIDRLKSKTALENVKNEYILLNRIYSENVLKDTTDNLKIDLSVINLELWEIEDAIREKERAKIFDQEFLQLARSVYRTNDKRAKIKQQINHLLNSELVEEKSYTEY
jgi:hypothetical protein